MKKYIAIMTAVFILTFCISPAYATTLDTKSIFQPQAIISFPLSSGSQYPISKLTEQYAWLFWPGLIAFGIIVVLIITIIKHTRNR